MQRYFQLRKKAYVSEDGKMLDEEILFTSKDFKEVEGAAKKTGKNNEDYYICEVEPFGKDKDWDIIQIIEFDA